jgi:hypothetical protein
MSTGVCWNKADDKKLIELFRTPHNGVDPEKLDTDTVKAVLEKIGHRKNTSTLDLCIGLKQGIGVFPDL